MPGAPDYDIQLNTIHSGFDRETFWVHSRVGAIPTEPRTLVLSMQKLLLSGSDIFFALHEMRSDDGGQTWAGPTPHKDALGRRVEPGGVQACACDFTPKWHAATGKLLGTGHVARYVGDHIMPEPRPRETAYSVYDPDARQWTRWDTVDMPHPEKFLSAGAGSTQRVDLPNGEILLPIYFRTQGSPCMTTCVTRCGFDGERLRCIEWGSEHSVPDPRGCCEPSLTQFAGRYFLTLRNDVRGYVTAGDDGLHFDEPRPWTFDDGSELGNYNTQQHWVTHADALFLAYTRRGADNDHVFRHRAPLFMAQVDPERLCVLRDTERAVVPERGARLGNFQTMDVTPEETWITAAEWMQPVGCEQYGSDNTIWAARILWKT